LVHRDRSHGSGEDAVNAAWSSRATWPSERSAEAGSSDPRETPVRSGPHASSYRGSIGRTHRMLRALLIRWAVVAAAFVLTAWLLGGMTVTGGVVDYLWLALVFGVVNALIGTILRILTLPLMFLTLGLFSIVVNAVVLEITDSLSGSLSIDAFFWTAIWAAIVLSIVSMILELVMRPLATPQTA
jgi:putative membrane protein